MRTPTPINIRSAVMSEEEAKELVGIYASRIIGCIQGGWADRALVQAASPKQYDNFSNGSISNLVYDLIVAALEREFHDDAPDVRIIKLYKRSVRLVIKDLLNARLNRTNAKGRIGYNNTYVQARFNTQQPEEQGVLPNFPYPTNIIITWQLNPAETEIETISVRCPLDRRGIELAWQFVIKSPTEVEVPEQFSTIIESTGRTSKVVSKKPRTEEETKAN